MLKLTPAAAALVLGLGLASAAPAAVVYNSDGFEPNPVNGVPRFVPGPLAGQDIPEGPWQAPFGQDPLAAVVQTTVVNGGIQAVQLTRTTSDVFVGVVKPITPSDRYVVVSFDMRVDASTTTQDFGPLFGVQANQVMNNSIPLIGSVYVDSTTNDVLIQEGGTGFLVDTGADVAFGVFNNYQLFLDYQTDTYTAYLNGTAIGTADFVDDGVVEIDGFTDADLTGITGGFGGSGTSYFDNYVIFTTDVIPEPTALSLLGISGLALLRRRR